MDCVLLLLIEYLFYNISLTLMQLKTHIGFLFAILFHIPIMMYRVVLQLSNERS